MNSNKIFENIGEKVAVIGQKVGNQKHLSAIRDGFASFIPFIIVGSFAILINSVIVDGNSLLATWTGANGSAGWMKFSFYVSPVFIGITDATMSFFSIYIAFLFGYFLSGSYGDNKIAGAGIGLACFLVLQPVAAGSASSVVWFSPTGFFGSTGILFAMIGGLGGPTIFHHLASNGKFSVHMPDGVPPAVSNSFAVLFPVIFTVLIFGLIQPIWGAFAYGVGFGKTEVAGTFSFGINVQFDYLLEENGIVFNGTSTLNINEGSQFYYYIGQYNTFYNSYNLAELSKDNDIWEVEVGEESIVLWQYLQTEATNQLLANNSTYFSIDNVQLINMEQLASKDNFVNIKYTYDGTIGTLVVVQGASTYVINGEWYYVINAVNTILVLPVQNAADTAGFVFVLMFLVGFFWFFGIHGNNILAPVISLIWTTAGLHNVEVLAAFNGDVDAAIASGLLFTFTDQTENAFLMMGGAGATIALLTAIFIFSKSPQHRAIANVATPSGIFQINEPVLFGLPIILNPLWAIPFMFVMPVAGVFIFLITAAGWLNPTTILLPWTTPIFISGFLSTQDWRSFIWTAVVFLFVFCSYLPFVLLDVRKQARAELNSGEYKEYDDLKSKIKEIKMKLDVSEEQGREIKNLDQINEEFNVLNIKKKNFENKFIDFMNIQIHVKKGFKNYKVSKDLVDEKFNLILKNKLEGKENKHNPIISENKKRIKTINTELRSLVKQQKLLNKSVRVNEKSDNLVLMKERKNTIKIDNLKLKIDRLNEKVGSDDKILILNSKIKALKNDFVDYSAIKKTKAKEKYDVLIAKAKIVEAKRK